MMDDFSKIPQIPLVIDTSNGERLSIPTLNLIFDQAELQDIRFRNMQNKRFVCYNCRQVIILSCISDGQSRNGHYYFFKHPNGIECNWKTNSKSKAEIYAGVKEGDRHFNLKYLVADVIKKLPEWKLLDVDSRFIFSPDGLDRTKPDVLASYNGMEIAFEIQLRGENPKNIQKRNKIHQERGSYVVWITADYKKKSDLEAETLKQVDKDIVYFNFGNRLVFDAEMEALSLASKEFTLKVCYLFPGVVGKDINEEWRVAEVPFSQLSFNEGKVYYFDYYYHLNLCREKLKLNGVHLCKKWISESQGFPAFESFLLQSKRLWPTFDKNEDLSLLHKIHKENFIDRQVELKRKVVEFLRSTEWRDNWNHWPWVGIANRVKHYPFGIDPDNNISVIEKLLLIHGVRLSESLCVERKSHIQSCHYFFDYEKFIPFNHLCLRAIKDSVYFQEIVKSPTMKDRLKKDFSAVDEDHSLDQFYDWFFTVQE